MGAWGGVSIANLSDDWREKHWAKISIQPACKHEFEAAVCVWLCSTSYIPTQHDPSKYLDAAAPIRLRRSLFVSFLSMYICIYNLLELASIIGQPASRVAMLIAGFSPNLVHTHHHRVCTQNHIAYTT